MDLVPNCRLFSPVILFNFVKAPSPSNLTSFGDFVPNETILRTLLKFASTHGSCNNQIQPDIERVPRPFGPCFRGYCLDLKSSWGWHLKNGFRLGETHRLDPWKTIVLEGSSHVMRHAGFFLVVALLFWECWSCAVAVYYYWMIPVCVVSTPKNSCTLKHRVLCKNHGHPLHAIQRIDVF